MRCAFCTWVKIGYHEWRCAVCHNVVRITRESADAAARKGAE